MTYFLAFPFSLILYHKIVSWPFTRFETFGYDEIVYEEVYFKKINNILLNFIVEL